LAPVWEQAATSLKGLVNVVKVDCTVDQSLCSKYDVKGYPTLKLFKNKGKKVQDYQQSRDLAAIVRFATGEIDDKSVKIKSDADLDKFLTKDSALPHVMLFSDKAAAAPLYKALSNLFEGIHFLSFFFAVPYLIGSIVFGLVSSKAQSVVNKYGPIEKFPHIIVSSADGTTRSYSGEIALEPLKTFLSEFGASADIPSESKPEAAKPAPKPAKLVTPAEWRDATKENIDEYVV
jgi:thiol-disulfide isomerase/thioredoxin